MSKPPGPNERPKWLPHLGLNPSANLPLQPHFPLLPQLATAASIPGRCGPVVWSQLSPSSSGLHYKSLFGAPLLAAPCYNLTSDSLSKTLPLVTRASKRQHTYINLAAGRSVEGHFFALHLFHSREGPERAWDFTKAAKLIPGRCELGPKLRPLPPRLDI